MKKVKSIVVYSIIIILFIAAFINYSTTNKTEVSSNQARSKKLTIEEKMKKSLEVSSTNPIVGIGRGEDFATVTSEAIKNAGSLKGIVLKGDTVIIKPNLATYSYPGSPIITDYRVVQEIVNMVKECGASKIIVAEASPGGTPFQTAGYENLTDVELVDMNKCKKEDCYELKPENSLTGKSLHIPKLYMDADVVISAAKLKTHYLAVATLSLKNSIGVPPTKLYGQEFKTGLHDMGLYEVIVDLNKIRKPDFVVIDGIIGGEGYGPFDNTPVKSNIVFAGIDPVAVDTIALNFMGIPVEDVPYVVLASEEGLGISDLNKIETKGADLDSIKMKFERY